MRAAADGIALTLSLLLRPSSWATRVKKDLGVDADFSLVDLWRGGALPERTSSFFGRSILGWLIVGATEGLLVLSLLGLEATQVLPALGILLVLCLGGGLVVAVCLSVAAALSGALIILAIFALGLVDSLDKVGDLGALNTQMASLSIPTGIFRGFAGAGERGLLAGLIMSMGIGIVGYLAARPDVSAPIRPSRRVTSAALTGIAVSAATAASALLVVGLLRGALVGTLGSSVVLGTATAFCVGCSIVVRRGILRPALYAFLATAIAWSALAALAFSGPLPLGGTVALVAGLRAAFFSSYFCLSFALASWVGGPWAGAFGAALGSGAAFAVRFGAEEGLWVAVGALLLKLGAVVLGVVLPLWLPVLSYPFELLWNGAVFQLDRNRGPRRPDLLSLNTGLWNDYQYLRLYGLDEHLYLVLTRDPAAGARYVATVLRGPQSWAAEAAELRILGDRIATIDSIDDLGRLHKDSDQMARLEEAGGPYARIAEVVRTIHHGRSSRRVEDRIAALRIAEAQLGSIAAELDGIDPTRRTFRRIVERWRDLVRDHVARLAAGLRRDRLANPYAVGAPVTAGFGVFVGRTDLAARIADVLESDFPPPVLVLGESRIGKSSLLMNLPHLLHESYLPCYTDLQHASGVADEVELYSCIAADLLEHARRLHGPGVPEFSDRQLRRQPDVYFRGWLEDLARTVSPRRLVLLVDEIEELESLRTVVDPRRLLGLLRTVSRHSRACGLLFAASRRITEWNWAGWVASLYSVEVGHLRRHEAEELILRPTADFPLRYTPIACARMITLSGCHPALLQRLCWEVVSGARIRHGKASVGLEEVEAAGRKTLEGGPLLLQTLIESLSVEDRRLLRLLAKDSHDTKMDSKRLQELIDRELVERRGSALALKSELLRQWLVTMPDAYFTA